MLDRNAAVHTLMRKKLDWSNTGDPIFPLAANVEGHSLKIRINDFPEKDLYSLIADGKAISDFNDWPQQWTKPKIDIPEVKPQNKGAFFNQRPGAVTSPEQLIEEFVKLYGNDSKSAVKNLILATATTYPDEFADFMKSLVTGNKPKPPMAKL